MKQSRILLILLILTIISCNSQKTTNNQTNNSTISIKKQKIDKIELREQTRGTNRIITFSSGSIITSLNENISKSELSSSDWENMVNQASLIDLLKMSSYNSPTTGRFSDRALSSTIIITSNGNTYESSAFDAGIPPKELDGLYQLLHGKAGIIKKAKPKFR